MITIASDMIVMCDCDDTLVMWNNVEWFNGDTLGTDSRIEFTDPHDNSHYYLKPHELHISLLKKYKAQGYMVIVWSAGGYRWAKSVVETLKLEDTVDIIMSKPLKYIDDLPASQIMGTRVYIPFEQVNKVIEPGEAE